MNTSLLLPVRVALYCLLASVIAVGGAGAEPALFSERQIETERQSGTERDETENRLRFEVKPDGSAAVTVSYRIALDEPNVTTAFEQLRSDIRANPARYSGQFAERVTEAAATAEVRTGREMAVENVSVHATRRGPDLGVITYTFVWRGFAATSDGHLSTDGALEEFVLYNDSRLTVAWPERYEPTTVQPAPDEQRSNAIVWTTPTTFEGNEPRITLSTPGANTNSSASGGESGEAVSNSPPDFTLELATFAVLLSVAIAITSAYTAYAFRRRSSNDTAADTSPTGIVSEFGQGTDVTNDGLMGLVKADDTSEPTSDDTDATELLSNDEQVLRVLEQHGGRMRQQQIVAATGWTEAKTSQVISGLRAEGKIEGFRLGRENILSLPDDPDDPDETGASSDNSA